jgi:spore coat protein U-like protein
MKKIYVVLAAVTLVIVMAGAAVASTSNVTVATSATVAEVCVVNAPGAIAFGTVDTDSAGAIAGTITAPDFACTALTAVAVSDDDGANETGVDAMRMTDGANFISYTIAYDSTLAGAGIAVNIGDGTGLNLTASIPAGALAAAPTGVYGDTIIFTISY